MGQHAGQLARPLQGRQLCVRFLPWRRSRSTGRLRAGRLDNTPCGQASKLVTHRTVCVRRWFARCTVHNRCGILGASLETNCSDTAFEALRYFEDMLHVPERGSGEPAMRLLARILFLPFSQFEALKGSDCVALAGQACFLLRPVQSNHCAGHLSRPGHGPALLVSRHLLTQTILAPFSHHARKPKKYRTKSRENRWESRNTLRTKHHDERTFYDSSISLC